MSLKFLVFKRSWSLTNHVWGSTLQIIVKYPSENFHVSDNFDNPLANWNWLLKHLLLWDDENSICQSRTNFWMTRRASTGRNINIYIYIYIQINKYIYPKRLRWSRGGVLAFRTQVRWFRPSQSRQIFKGVKILSTPSFGGEVKPSVPCRRFATCKRVLNDLEVVILAKLPDNILAHSSTFRR